MRKTKDAVVSGFIYLATGITLTVLAYIIIFIFIKGMGHINWNFLSKPYNNEVSYFVVEKNNIPLSMSLDELNTKVKDNLKNQMEAESTVYIEKIGAALSYVKAKTKGGDKTSYIISYIEKGSPLEKAKDLKGNPADIGVLSAVEKIGAKDLADQKIDEVKNFFNLEENTYKLKVVKTGGGIFTSLVTTLYMILLSLVIALPIGIFAAIYMTEYAKAGKLVSLIRFATESLAGIPSIIFGLFGMAFFVIALNLKISILSGSLTVAIILLPVIVRSTEEALKAVPKAYREGSYALGATKLQTIFKIVLPSAIPGIAAAVLLSVGRVIGESAALLLTAGTVAQIPKSLFSPGSTLTVQAYYIAKEEGNIEMACGIGIVILILVVVLNLASRVVTDKLDVTHKK